MFQFVRFSRQNAVLWKAKDLRKPNIQTLYALGTKVIAWTVDDPTIIRKFTIWGIDGIITNNSAAA